MAKYIDAVPVIHDLQTAADVMRLYYGDHAVVADVLSVVIDGLNKCPTADVAPVVHAKLKEDGAEDGLFCSVWRRSHKKNELLFLLWGNYREGGKRKWQDMLI